MNDADLALLQVRPGQEVRPVWERLLRILPSLRLVSGRGILITHSSTAQTINARAAVATFTGAFAVSLTGDFVSVGFGLVDGVEPTISGETITTPSARLKLKKKKGEEAKKPRWICVQAKIDLASGRSRIEEIDGLIIAETSHPFLAKEEGFALHPLAMLRPGAAGAADFQLFQIAYHSLRMMRLAGSPPQVIFAPV